MSAPYSLSRCFLTAFALLALAGCTGVEDVSLEPTSSQDGEQRYTPRRAKVAVGGNQVAVAGQLLVRFRSSAAAANANGRVGAKVAQSFAAVEDTQLVELPQGLAIEDALAQYEADPDVAYAEPNYIVHALQAATALPAPPNDPLFSELWGLYSGTDIDINAREAWYEAPQTNQTVVMIIDSGIDYNHPDLIPSLFKNPGETAGDGVDNDKNGYVDDVHGINAIDRSGDPMDDNDHGTHVAGTIAGAKGNGLGVTGVAANARLIGCKFLDAEGEGAISDALRCIDYARALKKRSTNRVNVAITNNSWGGGGFSQSFYDAIAAMAREDILFVAAAGNEENDNDASRSYPADYDLPNVISVGAVTSTGKLAYFSNYGKRSVDISAPGVNIMSTVPGNGYESFSGTSMATPHVTGLAALVKAQDPTRTAAEVRNLILTTGKPFAALSSTTVTGRMIRAWDSAAGGGALNCSGRTLSARIEPTGSSFALRKGATLRLAAYNVRCADALGAVQVSLEPGGEIITLRDDGVAPDLMANDGTVAAMKTFSTVGTYTLTFPNADTVTIDVSEEGPAPVTPPSGSGGCGGVAPGGSQLMFGLLGVGALVGRSRRRR